MTTGCIIRKSNEKLTLNLSRKFTRDELTWRIRVYQFEILTWLRRENHTYNNKPTCFIMGGKFVKYDCIPMEFSGKDN
jgi:hypothetical protein